MNIVNSPAMGLLFCISWALFFILTTQFIDLVSSKKLLHGRPFTPNWQRSLNLLVVTSPLVGLLGTVTGLREAFSALDKDEAGLAAALAEVLITTKLGLILALTGLMVGALLKQLRQRRL